MNGDLELVDEQDCAQVGGHDWLATEDMYGVEGAECARCGEIMGAA